MTKAEGKKFPPPGQASIACFPYTCCLGTQMWLYQANVPELVPPLSAWPFRSSREFLCESSPFCH